MGLLGGTWNCAEFFFYNQYFYSYMLSVVQKMENRQLKAQELKNPQC